MSLKPVRQFGMRRPARKDDGSRHGLANGAGVLVPTARTVCKQLPPAHKTAVTALELCRPLIVVKPAVHFCLALLDRKSRYGSIPEIREC